MQSITFALPTLTTAQMTRQDQNDILLNQATAAVVCCYLEHVNASMAGQAPGAFNFINQAELVSLINDVQAALRTVP